MLIYSDVETRSKINLTNHGTARYAADPSTGLNCFGYAIDDAPVVVLPYMYSAKAWRVSPLPHPLKDFERMANDPANKIVCHNVPFEYWIFTKTLGMEIPITQFVDTMAMCAYYGYPRGLDDAAKALNCTQLKDLQGANVMKKLMTGALTPAEAPADFKRLYEYNRVDIEVMREIYKKLPPLPPEIYQRWLVDFDINVYGMPLDLRALTNAVELRALIDKQNNERMYELSGGKISTVNQVAEIQQFAIDRGVEMVDCTADTVAKTLAKNIPNDVRLVLDLRQEAGLTSLAKFKKILDYQVGGRLYNMMDWYGAHTGRPTGSGPQVLNLPRSENPDLWSNVVSNTPELILQCSRPAERMKEGIRGVIKTDDNHVLIGVDLAQIEARATGWIAGAQNFLQLFLESDPYCVYGETIFGRKITKKENPTERTASKASMLSLGFAGGIGAYQRVAENYKIDFESVALAILPTASPNEYAEALRCYKHYMKGHPLKPLSERHAIAVDVIKQRYRRDFAKIKQFWFDMEDAFLHGGTVGIINVEARGQLRIVTLPNGSQRFYHGVRRTERVYKDPDDDEEKVQKGYGYMGRRGFKWMWRGTVTENMAQSLNAEISDWYKVRARQIGRIIHHCYDEFTLEVEKSRAEAARKELDDLLKTKPDWSEGLPLGFDIWQGDRYGK